MNHFFFLGHDFAPPGAETTVQLEENVMAVIPVGHNVDKNGRK